MSERVILLVEDNPSDEELTLRALKKSNILNRVVVVRWMGTIWSSCRTARHTHPLRWKYQNWPPLAIAMPARKIQKTGSCQIGVSRRFTSRTCGWL